MKITRWDLIDELATKEDIIEYLKVVLEDGSDEEIMQAITDASKAINAHGLSLEVSKPPLQVVPLAV